MLQIIRILSIVIIIIFFSGCAIHYGYMNNSASLNQANFSYPHQSLSGSGKPQSISGMVVTTYILGIGGLNKNAIVEEAKKEMMRKCNLKANQAIANVTVNWKTGYYLLWVRHKCTITADIVEFK